MSHRLHARRPAPHFGNRDARRPIDRRDSNPARALGHLLAGSLGVLAWVAVIYALVWIASVPA
ncbi:hypothetical protein [Pseudactinotalea sp. Z1732]|uniref:hypothetical protein n=1 Tax=Micrococcales TaxID=85006 RepID=UPI003C7E14A9